MESDLMDNFYRVKIEINKFKEYLQGMIKIIKKLGLNMGNYRIINKIGGLKKVLSNK